MGLGVGSLTWKINAIIVEMSLDRITAEEPHGKLKNVYNCSIHLRKISSLMKLDMSTLAKLATPSSVTEVGCLLCQVWWFTWAGLSPGWICGTTVYQLHLVISSSEI